MKINYEYKEFPKPQAGTPMTIVWRDMVNHQNYEFKRLTEAIKEAVEKEFNMDVIKDSKDDTDSV